MASSSKTERLGLNRWAETDRPKRSDFVTDNIILDSIVGAHVQNEQIHLTSDERDKLNAIISQYQYAGNGEAERSLELPFEPSFVFLFKRGEAPVVMNDGYLTFNMSYAYSGAGSAGGAALSGTTLTVKQDSAQTSGALYNLNRSFAQYTAVLFR